MRVKLYINNHDHDIPENNVNAMRFFTATITTQCTGKRRGSCYKDVALLTYLSSSNLWTVILTLGLFLFYFTLKLTSLMLSVSYDIYNHMNRLLKHLLCFQYLFRMNLFR